MKVLITDAQRDFWPSGSTGYIAEEIAPRTWKLYDYKGIPFQGSHSAGGLLKGNWAQAGWLRDNYPSDRVIREDLKVGDVVRVVGQPNVNDKKHFNYWDRAPDAMLMTHRVMSINPYNGALSLNAVERPHVINNNISPFTIMLMSTSGSFVFTPPPNSAQGIAFDSVAGRWVPITQAAIKKVEVKKEDDIAKLAEEGRRLAQSLGTATSLPDLDEEEEDDDDYGAEDNYDEDDFTNYDGDEGEDGEEDEISRMVRQAEEAQAKATKKPSRPNIQTYEDSMPDFTKMLWDDESHKSSEELPKYAQPENQIESNYRPRTPRPLRSRGKKMF